MFQVNQGYITLAIKFRSKFCDLYDQRILLLCCKFLIIILKAVREVAETGTLLYNVYKAIFLSKSRVCNSSNTYVIRVLWPLYTCLAYILTLLQVSNHYLENCRRSCEATNLAMPCVLEIFFVIQGYVTETRTLLCHLYDKFTNYIKGI